MSETPPRRNRGSRSLTGAVGTRPDEQLLDDWLGDLSDEDWSENAAERAERRRATPAYHELAVPEGDVGRDPTADRPAQAAPVAAAHAHRSVIERRRAIAGLGLAAVLGLGVAIAVLFLRGGAQAPVTSVAQPATTTPTPAATNPSSTPHHAIHDPHDDDTTNAFDEWLLHLHPPRGHETPARRRRSRRDQGAPAGPVDCRLRARKTDGTFGQLTEAAVIAFQQANGLSPDGIVGPETASALNSAVAGG